MFDAVLKLLQQTLPVVFYGPKICYNRCIELIDPLVSVQQKGKKKTNLLQKQSEIMKCYQAGQNRECVLIMQVKSYSRVWFTFLE